MNKPFTPRQRAASDEQSFTQDIRRSTSAKLRSRIRSAPARPGSRPRAGRWWRPTPTTRKVVQAICVRAIRSSWRTRAAAAFDVVVAEALDRLSRDQEHIAALFKHLSFAGVKIITLAEGEISALHVGLKGTMNALYLTDLRQKVWRGLEGRVRQGRSGGGLCYGYDVVRELDARGEPVCGKRAIDEAKVADQMSLQEIKRSSRNSLQFAGRYQIFIHRGESRGIHF